MRKIVYFIYFVVIVLAAYLSICNLPFVGQKTLQNSEFSAQRVSATIAEISREPHSIVDTIAKARVRDYLVQELESLGANVNIYHYDSIKYKRGGYFGIDNVFAEFKPLVANDSTQYITLIAHYDSRDFLIVDKKMVRSKGAADDGYGLGISIELTRLATLYRSQWNQGLRILFTDAEENGLNGIKSALNHNSEIFENSNLVINIEARGVKGPAMLFETSNNNSQLMDLYAFATNKSGFSLSTKIYSILPNYSDFTVLKDSIAGFNFAVLDNLKYYHTDLDNYNNISLKSIYHYGVQLSPIVKEYLVNKKYADNDIFISESSKVFFSYPILGYFSFTKTGYWVINILVYILFALILFLFGRRKDVKLSKIGLYSILVMFVMAFASLLGYAVSNIAAKAYSYDYSFMQLAYIPNDNTITVGVIGFMALVIILCFLYFKDKLRQAREMLFGLMFVNLVFSILGLVVIEENFLFFVPLSVLIAGSLFTLIKEPIIAILPVGIILSINVSFVGYILYIALSFGALVAVLPFVVLNLMNIVILPFALKSENNYYR